MGDPKIFIKEKEAAKDITDLDSIKGPLAGFIRVVTTAMKVGNNGHRQVFEVTDVKLQHKNGLPNDTAERYIRKWEAKKLNYASNSIVKILYPPKYEMPTFSEEMLKSGLEPKKTQETTAIETLAKSIEKLVRSKS